MLVMWGMCTQVRLGDWSTFKFEISLVDQEYCPPPQVKKRGIDTSGLSTSGRW